MTIPSLKIVHLTVATLGALSVIAVATAALLPMRANIVSYGVAQENALESRGDQHKKLLDYYQALEIFQTRVQNGETSLVRPDPNNRAGVRAYLKGTSVKTDSEAVSVASETEEATVLRYEDLRASDKAVIDRYQRAGKCSESLKSGAPGFFELCERMVKEAKTDRKHERRINSLMDASGRRGESRSRNYKFDLLQKLRGD